MARKDIIAPLQWKNIKSQGFKAGILILFSTLTAWIRLLFLSQSHNISLQLFRNIFAAVITYVINFAFLYYFTSILEVHYLISTVFAALISGIFNYVISSKWVFSHAVKSSSHEFKNFVKFALIGASGMGILLFFTWLFKDIFGIYYMYANALAEVFCFFFNFFMRKAIIFKAQKEIHKKI